MANVRFGSRRINLPGNKPLRIVLGGALVLLGGFGFLPILGFWMIPVGLLFLSADFPAIRRFNRRVTVRLVRWWQRVRGRSGTQGA